MRSFFAALLMMMTVFCANAYAGGIQGRASIKGEVREGVKIYAYKNFDTGLKNGYFSVSDGTGIDGTYKIDLPAGSYYFVARLTKDGGIDVKEGDLYCYYSGSPIEVSEKSYKNVGFNMIKVPAPLGDKEDKKSGVYGEITFEGKPLEKVYLFAYKNTEKDFKGPADYVFPSRKGKFKLRLTEGEFYLIARKRQKGGMYGPMEKDDIFNYYYGNPVKVEKGKLKGMTIECISRQDLLETPVDDETEKRGITVHASDEAGNILKGMYLLVYKKNEMTGQPDYISERSDETGTVFVELNVPGKYYLLMRGSLGGPAKRGELYSKYPKGDASVTLEEGSMHNEISFTVKKYEPAN